MRMGHSFLLYIQKLAGYLYIFLNVTLCSYFTFSPVGRWFPGFPAVRKIGDSAGVFPLISQNQEKIFGFFGKILPLYRVESTRIPGFEFCRKTAKKGRKIAKNTILLLKSYRFLAKNFSVFLVRRVDILKNPGTLLKESQFFRR